MDMDRRELLRIIAVTLTTSSGLAREHHQGSPAVAEVNIASYQPRALSPAQYKTLDALSEILIPAGEDGPGAHDAGVAYYLDTVLYYGDQSNRELWRNNLEAVASGADLVAVIDRLARNEKSPQTAEEKFFVTFKNAAIDAFYLSQAGRESANYRGDTALISFPGCTHPEHQSPPDGSA
jgi:hypothetical protein